MVRLSMVRLSMVRLVRGGLVMGGVVMGGLGMGLLAGCGVRGDLAPPPGADPAAPRSYPPAYDDRWRPDRPSSETEAPSKSEAPGEREGGTAGTPTQEGAIGGPPTRDATGGPAATP
jgi:predicted small lipoprotein YifL